ncbi:MAG TPA: hypothetical protein VER11_29810 [Polyangiaceae bacterium]|nr:hypothetical protein [Polyangiaceae bacterium]
MSARRWPARLLGKQAHRRFRVLEAETADGDLAEASPVDLKSVEQLESALVRIRVLRFHVIGPLAREIAVGPLLGHVGERRAFEPRGERGGAAQLADHEDHVEECRLAGGAELAQ